MSILAIKNLQLRGIELSLIGSAIFIAWLGVKFVIRYRKFSRFPLINGKRPFEFTWTQAKKRCYENAKELIQDGFTKNSNGFRLVTEAESRIILDPKYANELKNDGRLSLSEFLEHVSKDAIERQ